MKKPVYIFSSGSLRKEGNTLAFESSEGKKFIPIKTVSELYIFGECSITKKLLEELSSNEITVHFFNYYGFYIGTFYPRTHYNSGYMILKQAEHYLDAEKRLKLAKKFVEGSIHNMIKVLSYYLNRGYEVKSELEILSEYETKSQEAKSINELRGFEGNAKIVYYEALNKIISNPEFQIEERTRRPPKTRIDSLINFLNSLLYLNVLREIYSTHLDPRIGYLHETNFRSFSLNLDVSEVFKPIIVDRLVLSLIKKKMIDDSCFMEELGGVFLNEKGRRFVVKEFEEKMQKKLDVDKKIKNKISYRRLIRIELYKIEKHLMGEKEYSPFKSRW